MSKTSRGDGVSLAKGPVALVGVALLAYGITGLLFGGHGFTAHAVSGTVNGKTWLGLEGNGWTNLLFAGAGAVLLLGAPLHWGAKSLALVVGLVLGAASVIALVDGEDVFGIFAANGPTKLAWGVAAAVLLVLALLPRVGGDRRRDDDRAERPPDNRRVVRRTHPVEPARERASARFGDRLDGDGSRVSTRNRNRRSPS
jgi:hypothetical protein